MAVRRLLAAADALLDPLFACAERMEGVVNAFGPLLVSLVAFLVVGVFVFFVSVVLPFAFRDAPHAHTPAFWFSCWVMANITFNYAMATLSSPGIVPRGDFRNGSANIPVTECRHCKSPRPLRAHHCKACRRCILKMDHHCRIHYIACVFVLILHTSAHVMLNVVS
eukprot:Opistho-2@75124